MPKYHLDENALAAAMAILGFILWLVGVIWHGLMGQPSMMGYLYPRFSFTSPMHSVVLLIVFIVSFYIIGWLIATFYNWALKRR